MLISEEYRKINAELHKANEKYGNGIKYEPKSLLKLIENLNATSILDYGCGKAQMAKVLPVGIKLYDPAIPEYSEKPKPADLVLCMDVLEHVEPECLDDVIKDLFRVVLRMGIFLIDTKPSSLTLPDGRNAHLSLHTSEEWREKLKKYFDFVHIEPYQENLGTTFYVKPRKSLEIFDGIENKFGIDPKEPLDVMQYQMVEFGEWQNVNFYPSYLAYSLSQITEWFPPTEQPIHEEKVAICGYGPSLTDHIETLRKGNYKYIFTTSGSHDFLIKNGIIPTHHVEIDWKPHKSVFTKNSHPDVIYMVSCTCHPDTIDNVKQRKSILLFPSHGPQITLPDESYVMPTGYDAGQTCMVVAKLMGFRNMDLFGIDYSFTSDGHRHAGEHGGRVHFKFKAKVGDKVFETSKTMFGALLTMEYLLKNNSDFRITIFSNALFPHFILQRQKDALNVTTTTNDN